MMSLVPDYGNSSSSSSTSESEDEEATDKTEEPKAKLPLPSFAGQAEEELSHSSVFKNPFLEAENAKEALLQKHVKMVDSKDNVVVINGKKICWNYRKGRCRFGHNCKFAHDSDVQNLTSNSPVEELEEQSTTSKVSPAKKRKRPGLSQGLVPGKKVLKAYLQQKT